MPKDPEAIDRVEWSDAAIVPLPGPLAGLQPDRTFNAFCQNSYAARVAFRDGASIVVCLPVNARQRGGPEYWESRARDAALLARAAGQRVIEVKP